MSEKLSKEFIQSEYSKTIFLLGERAYRFCLPALEVAELLKRCLSLNQQMHQLLQEEAAEAKKKT